VIDITGPFTAAGNLRATSRIPFANKYNRINFSRRLASSPRASIATKWLTEAPIHHADAFPYNQRVSRMINRRWLCATMINRSLRRDRVDRVYESRSIVDESHKPPSVPREAKLCRVAVNVHQRSLSFSFDTQGVSGKDARLAFPHGTARRWKVYRTRRIACDKSMSLLISHVKKFRFHPLLSLSLSLSLSLHLHARRRRSRKSSPRVPSSSR